MKNKIINLLVSVLVIIGAILLFRFAWSIAGVVLKVIIAIAIFCALAWAVRTVFRLFRDS